MKVKTYLKTEACLFKGGSKDYHWVLVDEGQDYYWETVDLGDGCLELECYERQTASDRFGKTFIEYVLKESHGARQSVF